MSYNLKPPPQYFTVFTPKNKQLTSKNKKSPLKTSNSPLFRSNSPVFRGELFKKEGDDLIFRGHHLSFSSDLSIFKVSAGLF